MPINPNTLNLVHPWNLTFLPWADRIAYSATLAGETYAAVSGGAIEGKFAWTRLRMDGNTFAFIGAAAPGNDKGSILIRAQYTWTATIPPGKQLWVRREATTNRKGSCEVWILG